MLEPFPHVIIHYLESDALLRDCVAEIPNASDARWRRFRNDRERKLEGGAPMWGPQTCEYFDRLAGFAETLALTFDLGEVPTLEMIGGGYHLIAPGGYLDVHTDFSVSPKTGRYRRINVLTYLNDGWGDDDGGELELWDDDGCVVKIKPEFGTTVAFTTSATSWHGHPNPTKRWRASLAGYFFTEQPPPGFVDQSTRWHPNGGNRA